MRALTNDFPLLDRAITEKASDLHLNDGSRPWMRINNLLAPCDEQTDSLLNAVITLAGSQHDYAFTYKGRRWRVGLGTASGGSDAVLRLIPNTLIPLSDLSLPDSFMKRVALMEGLILVTAPTGSGKTSTLNSVIHHLNDTIQCKIVTLEDPIEYLHQSRLSLIRQRELHSDFPSFSHAIERSLRHDPDVIVVGEIRDVPTITAALSAAETGHLVFGTLHTRNASSALSRILDMASDRESAQIRAQLSQSLSAVLAQRLVPAARGGRVAAYELLLKTPAVSSIISSSKLDRLQAEITSSGTAAGMVSMDQSLARLVKQKIISTEAGKTASEDPVKFSEYLKYA